MSTLESFGPDIWVAEGPVVSFYGFPYPTRMVLIRLSGGGLFVWSPIALTPELKAEVDALGPVAHLISPNKIHHLYMGEWKAAYPGAKLHASPGLAKRRKDLRFDGLLGDCIGQGAVGVAGQNLHVPRPGFFAQRATPM
jgi:hypothetical protein